MVDTHLSWLLTWSPLLDLLGLVQFYFLSLTFPSGFPFSLFAEISTALLTFSVTLMAESAEALSDSSEPFRVRRYRKQTQEVPSPRAPALHSALSCEERPACSDSSHIHEVPEDCDPDHCSDALCIPHDAFIPASQCDDNLFFNSELDPFSDFLPDSNALPLQDQSPPVTRCLLQQPSDASVSGDLLSAELVSTVPFSVVMGPPSSDRTTQTENSGVHVRTAWATGRSVSRSRSRGPSLPSDSVLPKPPPLHPLRATGTTVIWSPLPRPVPSSRGHYSTYPSACSTTVVPKASADLGVHLQAVPKKAHSFCRTASFPVHHPASPGHVGFGLAKGQRVAFAKSIAQEVSTNLVSSASVHSRQWKKALLLWRDLALSIASASSSITEILASPMCATLLEHLLRRISDTTALRYIATCTKVIDSITALSLPLSDPTQVQLLDAIFAMQRSFRRDPGVHSDNVLKALRWLVKAASMDNWPDLYDGLFATTSWRTLSPKKESVPLPLAFLLWLETCILFDTWPARKILAAGAILLCVYASLRFSDAQHIDFTSIVIDKSSLRAGSFRTKTSHWMPFGIYIGGLYARTLQQSWVLRWLHSIESATVAFLSAAQVPDFIFMEFSDDTLSPMSYCAALGCLRAFLAEWGQLSDDQLAIYTLHSMKCTLLSFYRQCDYSDDVRHLQGHHKALTSMRLYGRDDVSPCIAQHMKFIQAVRQGWRARTPLLRGVSFAAEEPSLHFADPSRFWHFRENLHFFKMASESEEQSTGASDLQPAHVHSVHSQSEASFECVLEESDSDESLPPSLGAADEVPLCISNAGLVVHVSLQGRPACGSQGTFHSVDSVPDKARLCKHKSCAFIFADMH